MEGRLEMLNPLIPLLVTEMIEGKSLYSYLNGSDRTLRDDPKMQARIAFQLVEAGVLVLPRLLQAQAPFQSADQLGGSEEHRGTEIPLRCSMRQAHAL